MTEFEANINTRIWQVVAAIPTGKVSTYGAIAKQAGLAGAARRVGTALKGLPADTRIPWHRVVNSQGKISLPAGSPSHDTQRERLEEEGIRFSSKGKINLSQQGW